MQFSDRSHVHFLVMYMRCTCECNFLLADIKIRPNVLSMKQALRRIYKLNSDTFHTFLVDLIPRARENKSHLFT